MNRTRLLLSTILFISLLILDVSGSLYPRPQNQADRTKEWLGIKGWTAMYHETFLREKTWESGPGMTMSTRIETKTSGTFTLDEKMGGDSTFVEWYGLGSGSYTMTKTSVLEGHGVRITEITKTTSSGRIGTGNEEDYEDQYGGNVAVDLYSGTYSFGFAEPTGEGETTLTRIVEGLPSDYSQIGKLPEPLRQIFLPLGAKAQEIANYSGPISGTSPMLVGDILGYGLMPDMSMPTEFELPKNAAVLSGSWSGKDTSFSWLISPSGAGEPLYLEKCPSAWRPKVEEGNTVPISLEGDGWYGAKVKVRFRLYDITNEKGTCLNSPDKNEGPDLDFAHDSNRDKFQAPEEKKIPGGTSEYFVETRDPESTATITVVSRDGGAWGRLEADVLLTGSDDWFPVFTKKGNRSITIPLDEEGGENYMADSWEKRVSRTRSSTYKPGSPPQEDADDFPQNPHKGDGLTNYEEYRGFLIQGNHKSTNPGIKDLFMHVDDRRLVPGIRKFEQATDIRVHMIKAAEYVSDNERVVNSNRGKHTLTEQHGIFVTAPAGNPGGGGVLRLGMAMGTDPNGLDMYGRPGNPGYNPGNPSQTEQNGTPAWKSKLVVYPANHKGQIPLEYTVVHELLHCLSVDHHGSSFTSGQNLCNWGRLSGPDCSDADVLGNVVTFWGGPNSGDDSCVVSYPPATFFTDSTGAVARGADGNPLPFQAAPDLITHICRDRRGTGHNAGGGQVGDATKGNCWDQIKIADGGH